ncbi:MAG: alpha/beta hydrolase [Kineosporiaceae bacterium]
MTITRARGLVALVAGTALAAPAAVAYAAPATEPATEPAPEPAAVSDLEFADCDDGFECGTLTVPLSYAGAAEGDLDLSVIRRPAADPANRIGALLANPGGPGGSGVDFVRGTAGPDGILAELNQRFDIVSWDPRGTKGSSPVDCFDDARLDTYYAEAEAFPDGEDRDAVLATGREFIDACVTNAGPELLSAISTENTARDMDALRAALGEEQISYLGYSYGTYLGATYASLFPDRIRAFVLDGAVDPDAYANNPLLSDTIQARGFEVAIDRFFEEFCADACAFAGGKDAWRDLVEQLEAEPLTTGGDPERPVDGAAVINATLISMYVRQIWPVLDQALADAGAGDGAQLQVLADIAIGRNDDGSYDPGQGAFPAINAVDRDYPEDVRIQDLMRLVYEQVSPSFGPSTWVSLAGGYSAFEWPVEADDRFAGPFEYPSDRLPILVVGNTFDPATPYSGSLAMTEQLGNAELLTLDGDGHTAYGGNSTCIDDAVDAFLVDGTVPAAGTVCEYDPDQEPGPTQPTGAGASTLSGAVEGSAGALVGDEVLAELNRFSGTAR